MVNFHSGGNSSVVSHGFLYVMFKVFVDGLNTKRKEFTSYRWYWNMHGGKRENKWIISEVSWGTEGLSIKLRWSLLLIIKVMCLAENQFWLCICNDGEVLLFSKNIVQSPNSVVTRKENWTLGTARKGIETETNIFSTYRCLWLLRALHDYDSLFPKSAVEL